MTRYTVEFTPGGKREFEETVDWYCSHSDEAAGKWLQALESSLDVLEATPERCPSLREQIDLPAKFQELAFGVGSRRTHRLIFVVRPEKVTIHALRHLAQRDLTAEDL